MVDYKRLSNPGKKRRSRGKNPSRGANVLIGAGSGAVLGAVLAGPVGAAAGAVVGVLVGAGTR